MKHKLVFFVVLVGSLLRTGYAEECSMRVTGNGDVEVILSIKEVNKLIRREIDGENPVIDLESTPSWYGGKFDLIYDGTWVKIADTVAELNNEDHLLVSGKGDYVKGPLYGMRFVTGDAWEKFASGQKIRISLTVKSAGADAVKYKVSYATNEVGSSGWRESIAGKEFTTFSFDYAVPRLKEGKKDFLIVVPEYKSKRNSGILIEQATLDVIKQ